MVIDRDLDIKISYLLNVIFPASIGVSIFFGLFSTVSFFYYCYQLIRSCSRRSCCHRGGYTKEDYLYNYDFKSLKGKPSDKAISCENSGGSPGKMDSNLVRKNLKEPKDFFKDSINSSNEHKPQSTDVESSRQFDRRGHNIVTDQQDRSISRRTKSYGRRISPEDHPRNNYSKSLEDITSDMASTSGNSDWRHRKIKPKLVHFDRSDSNNSSEDSIHSPKEYKQHSTDFNKSSQYDRRELNFDSDQLSRSFSRQSNSHRQRISPEDYPHNNHSKSLERGRSDMTSISENSRGRGSKIEPKLVRKNLSDSNDSSEDSIQSSKEQKQHPNDLNKSSQDIQKGQNVVSDQPEKSLFKRFNSFERASSSDGLLRNDDLKSLDEGTNDMASTFEIAGRRYKNLDFEQVRENLQKPKDSSKVIIHSPKEHKPHSTDLNNSSQYNQQGHNVVPDQQGRSSSRQSNSHGRGLSLKDYPHNNDSKSLVGKSSDNAISSGNSFGRGSMIEPKRVRRNLFDSNYSSKESIHPPKEHTPHPTDFNKSLQDIQKGQNVVSGPKRYKKNESIQSNIYRPSLKSTSSDQSIGRYMPGDQISDIQKDIRQGGLLFKSKRYPSVILRGRPARNKNGQDDRSSNASVQSSIIRESGV